MPRLRLHACTDGEFEMHYEVDSFVEPWRMPETVLMLHGNSESGAVWYGWMPDLTRHYRIVRPDMRGFGASSAMPSDHTWTLDELVDDYVALMRTLNIPRFHLVGAKFGGTVARRFASRHPELLQSLTLVGAPQAQRAARTASYPAVVAEVETQGVEGWARRTMGNRLGKGFDPDGVNWWIQHMGKTASSTQIGFMKSNIAAVDGSDDLPRITCPTLVIASPNALLGSIEEVKAWQERIPNSRLHVVSGDSYHVAASAADECAQETLRFIQSNRAL